MAASKGAAEEMSFALALESDTETKKPSKKHILWYVLAGVFILALLGLVIGLYFGLKTEGSDVPQHVPSAVSSRCHSGTEFHNFSVSTDTAVCSEIGCHVLEKGGSAVDAAIASMFCISVVTMHSSGIGGGAFMLIYKKQTRKAVFVNSREKAPRAAKERMYVDNEENSVSGPLSAGVPGEVKGMIVAHREYGKLSWKDLVQPAIDLASRGFKVTTALQNAIEYSGDKIKDPEFRILLQNDGHWVKAGDIIVNKKLAKTLREIQKDPESFYTGKLAKKIAADFEKEGLITEEDLRDYTATLTDDVLRLDLDGVTMYSCPPPSGGPVVTQIFNILQNFKFNRSSIANVNNTILTYHRIIEAFKFAYARRPFLGDPEYVIDGKMEEAVKNATDVEYNRNLFKMIWDNSTHNYSYYGGYSEVRDPGSTSHLSVIAPNGDAVSVTGSVNYYFGGKFRSSVTGIIYNNEMDDFSTPGKPNGYGYQPSKYNFIKPGKRPLSSMSPTIFIDRQSGDVKLAVGAAGGSRIISSTAWVSLHNLWFGDSLSEAVKRPRLHHQFNPNAVDIESYSEYKVSEEVQNGLRAKGHSIKEGGKSVVQAVGIGQKKAVFAASDPRKGGAAWGL